MTIEVFANSLGNKAGDAVGSLGVLAPAVLVHRVHWVIVDAVVHAIDTHKHGEGGL